MSHGIDGPFKHHFANFFCQRPDACDMEQVSLTLTVTLDWQEKISVLEHKSLTSYKTIMHQNPQTNSKLEFLCIPKGVCHPTGNMNLTL